MGRKSHDLYFLQTIRHLLISHMIYGLFGLEIFLLGVSILCFWRVNILITNFPSLPSTWTFTPYTFPKYLAYHNSQQLGQHDNMNCNNKYFPFNDYIMINLEGSRKDKRKGGGVIWGPLRLICVVSRPKWRVCSPRGPTLLSPVTFCSWLLY